MRIFLFIIPLNLFSLASQAQTTTYDTLPFIPDYHKQRLEAFRKEPAVLGRVIFLGNSITEAGDWKALLKDTTVINRGIAGDITFGILNRLDEVIARKPSKLFIKIGINDISKDIPDAVIVQNIIAMVNKVRSGSPTTKIFVQSILPTNESVKAKYPQAYNKNKHVFAVNNQLVRYAKTLGYTFVDLSTKFQDEQGNLDARYATDGLHLNTNGYRLWVEILKVGKYL